MTTAVKYEYGLIYLSHMEDAGLQDNSCPLTTDKHSDKQETTALKSAYGKYSH